MLVFGRWSRTFPSVWILVPTFFPCCGTVQKELKGADLVCTLLHTSACALTSLLIVPEKLDRPSARRCLVSPGLSWQLVVCAGRVCCPDGLCAKGPGLLVLSMWVQLLLGKQLDEFNWV